MDRTILIVPMLLGLAGPVLLLRGIYGMWGWWGLGAVLAALVALAVLNHLAHRRARAMCPAYRQR